MGLQFDGHGTTITRAGLTLNPKKIVLPGASREEIDVSTLNNTAFKTFVLGALAESSNLVVTYEFDASAIGAIISSGNLLTTLTFPDSGGSIAVWCDVMEVGDPEFENHDQPTFDVTFKVTNLNDSNVETVPAFTAAP